MAQTNGGFNATAEGLDGRQEGGQGEVTPRMSLRARRELLTSLAPAYARAAKREKERILDTFIQATGYHRKHAIELLNHPPAPRKGPVQRPRAVKYGDRVQKALVKVWEIADHICAKRLVAAVPYYVEALERHGELELDPRTRELLLQVSATTADRLLKAARRQKQGRGLSTTKPGTLLKKQIPIRTFADWDDDRPGFLEVDLVAHCGGTARGEFLYTLTLTDICTGWTECLALPNRGEKGVLDAFHAVRKHLPFAVLGLDCDNGGEFVNHHLFGYCQREQITMTRCRPYKKNDQAHVEQKNYSVVRRLVGYSRLEGAAAHKQLTALYRVSRLYVNFFQPCLKLISKTREHEGAKPTKKYDRAQTPYHRLLAAGGLAGRDGGDYEEFYRGLNPAALRRQIGEEQTKLHAHKSES